MPQTIIDRIWDAHVVVAGAGGARRCSTSTSTSCTRSPRRRPSTACGRAALRRAAAGPHLRHDRSQHPDDASPPADRGRGRRAGRWRQFEANCREFGITCYGRGHERQGIVHVIGPELGLTQPGMTIVCGDSHTATHGAFGALAFGIGTSEVEMVLASQCLLQRRPKTLRVDGRRRAAAAAWRRRTWSSPSSRAWVWRRRPGTSSNTRATASAALSMEQRMTLCNMSIEAGARAGLVAPDDTTLACLPGGRSRRPARRGTRPSARWRALPGEADAVFDREVCTCRRPVLRPMITFGTNPGMAMGIDEPVPDPAGVADETRAARRSGKALDYMHIEAGRPLTRAPRGRGLRGQLHERAPRRTCARRPRSCGAGTSHPGVRMLVVPGSRRSRRRRRPRGWTACSGRPGRSGASRAARCASR